MGAEEARRSVAGIVLAAGLSRRMGPSEKLTLRVDEVPMIRRVTLAALRSRLDPVVVVARAGASGVRESLAGLEVILVENARPEEGLSSSLRAGLEVLPRRVLGVVVLLGDMPWVTPDHIRALVEAFDPAKGREICVPSFGGRRGNPVLWSSRFLGEIMEIRGDTGAKALLDRHAEAVREVFMEDDGVLRDVDTPDQLDAPVRGR